MKYKLLIVFLIIICHSVKSQSKGIIVEYDAFFDKNNTSIVTSKYLFINNNEKWYISYGDFKERLPFEDFFNENIDLKKLNSIYLYEDDGSLLFLGINAPPKRVFVKDNPPTIEWKLEKDEKEILGYKCKKAIGEFRGRNYTVWYAPDLPYNAGPWKLNGLPGLILESYDSEELYDYYARRIIINKKIKIPKSFTNYINDKKSIIMPHQEYIQREDEYFKKKINQLVASIPVNNNLINIETDTSRKKKEEKSFEWETEKKP